jgi:hypothetical protein
MPKAIAALLLLSMTIGAAPAQAGFPDGFYIGLGFGGAPVFGSRGIRMQPSAGCPATLPGGSDEQIFMWSQGGCVYAPNLEYNQETSRTDYGGGLGALLKIGYNILGYVSVEAAVSGHGSTSADEGNAYVALQLRYHFVQHIVPLQERDWDANVFGGIGYVIGGYDPKLANEDKKGWEGYHGTVGAAFNWAVHRNVSLGAEARVLIPRYTSWLVNFDDGVRESPAAEAGSVVFMPVATLTVHIPASLD